MGSPLDCSDVVSALTLAWSECIPRALSVPIITHLVSQRQPARPDTYIWVLTSGPPPAFDCIRGGLLIDPAILASLQAHWSSLVSGSTTVRIPGPRALPPDVVS